MQSFKTARFGDLRYGEDDILRFPRGIPGFEAHTRWVLAGEDDHPVKWLQSLDDGEVALPVTAPGLFFPDYHVNLPKGELDVLELDDEADMALLVVVAVPDGDPLRATINLRAPIVVNGRKRLARQVISLDEQYEVRHLLFGREQNEAAAGPLAEEK